GRLSGFTEKETLKTWTTLLGVTSVVGVIQLIVAAWIFPCVAR
ncbi:MAG: H+/gluconate symporter-like permease, partial [Candidatus Binatia bacterium]